MSAGQEFVVLDKGAETHAYGPVVSIKETPGVWAVETPATTIFVDKRAGRTHRLRAIVPKVDERAEQARAIARVRALHAPFEWSFGQGTVRSCTECARLGGDEGEAQYPCATIRALDGIERAPRHAPATH